MTQILNLKTLMLNYTPGDPHSWEEELAFLRTEHAQRISALTVNVARNGILYPIQLGHDGRVWDGHHRIAVADALGLASVPVEVVQTPQDGAPKAEPGLDDNAAVQALKEAARRRGFDAARDRARYVIQDEIQALDAKNRSTTHSTRGYSEYSRTHSLLVSLSARIRDLEA